VHAALPVPGRAAALRYDGTDTRALCALAAAGHGLALLPRGVAESAAAGVAVPLAAPRLVHRTELLAPGVPSGPSAAALAERLTTPTPTS
ncbi:LysR family transcriptional regulator, partial [Streptomyces bambusae]|nr:LysR family transcriptional regulator [Streptomyces bambusae]